MIIKPIALKKMEKRSCFLYSRKMPIAIMNTALIASATHSFDWWGYHNGHNFFLFSYMKRTLKTKAKYRKFFALCSFAFGFAFLLTGIGNAEPFSTISAYLSGGFFGASIVILLNLSKKLDL